MGLAAGQARLLTITGRKSDCEYESMRLSHQKLALSRQLTDISNEYQNSLDQTKLIYDYYGTGDESNPLSYGILMNPSTLNNFMPILLTDPKGRTTLNSKLATAARAAGIPQEGFGTLPAENVRNKFIQELGEQNVITKNLATTIQGLPYNQTAGIGGGTTVAAITASGNVDDLIKYISNSSMNIEVTVPANINEGVEQGEFHIMSSDSSKDSGYIKGNNSQITKTFNLGNLLSTTNPTQLSFFLYSNHTGKDNAGPSQTLVDRANGILDNVLDQVGSYMSDLLDLGDGYTSQALEYAYASVQALYSSKDLSSGSEGTNWVGYLPGDGNSESRAKADKYIGWTSGGKHKHNHNRGNAAISINNLLQAYITYFADFMNGVSKTDINGKDLYSAGKGEKSNSNLIKDDKTYQFTWKTGTSVSSDDTALATFYDSLFNQICLNGWTENNNIEDNEYLQQMLKSGMLFISKPSDDGYYYQGNYATDNYIKEVSDDTKIAQAEAKYNTEKAKLNSKEETLDLKMKNLDTEISSLTTEYDTVKNTISKNIEKSFKRYNA